METSKENYWNLTKDFNKTTEIELFSDSNPHNFQIKHL